MEQRYDHKEKEENIEVWEDLVHIKDLVLAIIISTITTLGAYLIAPNDPPKPLIFGLIGAVVAFVICSLLINPKRSFRYVDEEGE
ncbi:MULTISPECIES: hypothetical protein [Clostridia]|uniref:hypothetical protein n=1 Tax=Clostridia TaxID=186801 RepID=UPI000EA1B783|nr:MULTISPECIES: hypothetical protein [Clostridia]NBJ68030.1 hypothetical protein [Roseburia sp. 1XD42-34]RKI82471.1 hypothetical protein D7V87_00875 [Clostridium sp. 1xD42-85]